MQLYLEKTTKANKSGITGIHYDSSRNKWLAQIWFKNKHHFLGRYNNKEDAIKSRQEAKERLHKEFLRSLKD